MAELYQSDLFNSELFAGWLWSSGSAVDVSGGGGDSGSLQFLWEMEARAARARRRVTAKRVRNWHLPEARKGIEEQLTRSQVLDVEDLHRQARPGESLQKAVDAMQAKWKLDEPNILKVLPPQYEREEIEQLERDEEAEILALPKLAAAVPKFPTPAATPRPRRVMKAIVAPAKLKAAPVDRYARARREDELLLLHDFDLVAVAMEMSA